MKICMLNGSPRGLVSNSTHLIKWINKGLESNEQVHLIKNIEKHDFYIKEIIKAETIFITFPLYVDAMPGIVMKFFENLAKHKGDIKGKNIYFLVHSGFPEAIHSFPVRDYLVRLSKKLDLNLVDVIIYGSSEGTRFTSEDKALKKKELFMNIGKSIKENTMVSPQDRKKVQTPIKLNKPTQIIFKTLSKVVNINAHWDNILKKNNAYDKRFDTPYQDK